MRTSRKPKSAKRRRCNRNAPVACALAVIRDPVEFRRLLRMLPADHPLCLLASPARHDVRDP